MNNLPGDIHLGIGIFGCCGLPHVIFTCGGGLTREQAEIDFAISLANAYPVMGEASQTMLLTMRREQFMQIEMHYHSITEPEPSVHMIVADSPADLEAKLREIGVLQGDPFEAQTIVNEQLKKH